MTAATLTSRPGGALRGSVRAPGDKSMSHRALILGALAEGVSQIDDLLEGADVLATAGAMRAFGAEVAQVGPGRWRVKGVGGFEEPHDVIDFGNSGTGVRLAMGAAAASRLAEEADRYAKIPAYGANFERQGVKPIDTAISVQAPAAVAAALERWRGAVDEVVLRAITATDTLDENLALVRAARPA